MSINTGSPTNLRTQQENLEYSSMQIKQNGNMKLNTSLTLKHTFTTLQFLFTTQAIWFHTNRRYNHGLARIAYVVRYTNGGGDYHDYFSINEKLFGHAPHTRKTKRIVSTVKSVISAAAPISSPFTVFGMCIWGPHNMQNKAKISKGQCLMYRHC